MKNLRNVLIYENIFTTTTTTTTIVVVVLSHLSTELAFSDS